MAMEARTSESGFFLKGLFSSKPSLDILAQKLSKSRADAKIVAESKSAIATFFQAIVHGFSDNLQDSKSDIQKTIEHFNSAIQLAEQANTESKEETDALSCLYYCRGIVALALSSMESGVVALNEAIADFKKSAELSPLADTYFHLGEAYALAGCQDKAIENFEQATELNIHYAEAYLSKGLIHRERGEEDDAHEDIYYAITINPELYREEFEPIMQAERESETVWDELLSRPESEAMLTEWDEQALEALRTGKTKPAVDVDEES